MAQKKKTIKDYQETFKQLFREMEKELGAKVSDVRIYATEQYLCDNDNGNSISTQSRKGTTRVVFCNFSFSDDVNLFAF